MAKTTTASTESKIAKGTTAKPAVKEESKSKKSVKKVSDEEIRVRAYQIYLDNGCQANSDQKNWLQALKELSVK